MKRGRVPKGYVKATKDIISKLQKGDKVVVDLGGIELATGSLDTMKGSFVKNNPVEFWSYHGWKHLEVAKKTQIKYVKFKK